MIKLDPKKIRYLIVHHSATNRDLTTFEAIKRYHIKERGWADIGYHWVITGDGELHKGRSEEYVGSHCRTPAPSMNFRSLGICLTGDFTKEFPSSEQFFTLASLLKSLVNKYRIPYDNVLGHVEVAATLCPGPQLLNWVRNWREENKKKATLLRKIAQLLKDLIQKYRDLLKRLGGS